jgi:hypothetical protein
MLPKRVGLPSATVPRLSENEPIAKAGPPYVALEDLEACAGHPLDALHDQLGELAHRASDGVIEDEYLFHLRMIEGRR